MDGNGSLMGWEVSPSAAEARIQMSSQSLVLLGNYLSAAWGLVPDEPSGGAHTSRTIMLAELRELLASCDPRASLEDYSNAVLRDNVLGKRSDSTRLRSLRYLRELYVLDSEVLLFRALRDLWDTDPEAQPLLALECALARDPLLRSTASAVLPLAEGTEVDSVLLAEAVSERYPHTYRPAVAAKIGRNTASSWTQSGHLAGRSRKMRVCATPLPASLVFALLLGHLSNARGLGLFETSWAAALDRPKHTLMELAFEASQRSWIDFKRAGNVVEVGFQWLLRPRDA
jgi:hypothetical protein